VVGVITQPDRPAGRGGQPQPPPVRRTADALGLGALVVQPATLRDPAMHAWIAATRADVGVVAAYGEILRRDVLALLPHGYLNIHPSLLPAFGGKGMYGHHVHEAVLEYGAKVSGCTVHFADDTYDTGPILVQKAVPVLPDDTPGALAARVFAAECEAYPEAIRALAEGRAKVEGRRVIVAPG